MDTLYTLLTCAMPRAIVYTGNKMLMPKVKNRQELHMHYAC